jgi:hypothetical protein
VYNPLPSVGGRLFHSCQEVIRGHLPSTLTAHISIAILIHVVVLLSFQHHERSISVSVVPGCET